MSRFEIGGRIGVPAIGWRASCVALLAMAGIAAALSFWFDRWQPDPERQQALALVGGLFSIDETQAALAAIEVGVLRDTPEGAFASGVIQYYTPFPDFSRAAARSSLGVAAEGGFPAAMILFGWALELDQECMPCVDEAAFWFRKALREEEDREARLGLALALIRAGDADEADRQIEALLAEPKDDHAHLFALALHKPRMGELHMKPAAEEGWSEAQYRLATRFMDKRSPEAMLWLAMAAAQGHVEAAAASATASPGIKAEAERRLLEMAADETKLYGQAARWCARNAAEVKDRRLCRLHALEDDIACGLPRSTTDALGIAAFAQTQVYARCRSNRLP